MISMVLATMVCFCGVVASRTNFSGFSQEIVLIIADVADGSTGLTIVAAATGGTDLIDLIAVTDVIADVAGNRMLTS